MACAAAELFTTRLSSARFRRWQVDTTVVEDVEDELEDLEDHDDGDACEQAERTPECWDQSGSLKRRSACEFMSIHYY